MAEKLVAQTIRTRCAPNELTYTSHSNTALDWYVWNPIRVNTTAARAATDVAVIATLVKLANK